MRGEPNGASLAEMYLLAFEPMACRPIERGEAASTGLNPAFLRMNELRSKIFGAFITQFRTVLLNHHHLSHHLARRQHLVRNHVEMNLGRNKRCRLISLSANLLNDRWNCRCATARRRVWFQSGQLQVLANQQKAGACKLI